MTDSRLLFEGKYEILAKVREGGMGAIYKVRHRLLDEVRVIKVMRAGAGEPELETRFLHEAKIATRLRHPNLCATHDFAFDEEGTAYLVMEYVDGVNLAEFMKQRGLPGVPLTLEIAHQALLALGYLHRKGVVHRDVAPDNLMLAFDEDGRPLVKLIDLGIARVADRDADLTANGIFLGKPRYASPEQLGSLPPGEKLDGRSDLYCLGVVLYELLTGRLPFEGKSPADLLRAQQLNRILPFEESDPQARVPTDLRAVVLQALERKRSERFQTADEFDRAVVALQGRFSGPRHEITPEIAAAIRRAPSAASEIAAVRAVDPDPLHTVRLPFERPVASGPVSVEDVLIGNGPPAPDDDRFDRSLPPRSAARSTPVAPRDISAALPHDMGTPLKRVPARRKLRYLEVAAFAAAGIGVLAVWWSWPSRGSRSAGARPASASTPAIERPTPMATPLEEVAVTPPPADAAQLAAPAPAPNAAPVEAPTNAPEAQAEAAPTPAAAEPASPRDASAESPARAAPGPGDALAQATAENASAKRDADDARAREFAPTTYGRALTRQSAAERLAARGSSAEAAAAYRQSADLFGRAAAAARQTHPSTPASTRGRRTRASAAAPAPGRAPEVVPEGATAATAPDAAARTEAAPDAPAGIEAAPTPAPSEQQPAAAELSPAARAEEHRRIVQTIGDYAWARRHRKADVLARVFPSEAGRMPPEPASGPPPAVTVEVQAVDFESATRAKATVQERVGTAATSGGREPEWETIVFDLEKRGDRWIIVARWRL